MRNYNNSKLYLVLRDLLLFKMECIKMSCIPEFPPTTEETLPHRASDIKV